MVAAGDGGPSPPVDLKWKIDVHHIPKTRPGVGTISNGVPVGAHSALLSCNRIGNPFAKTLVEATENTPVTHGPFPAGGGGMAQPATW
jgi:hypothetical protein